MNDGRKKSSVTLLLVCIIAIMGFKDTGVFVSDFVLDTVTFMKGEEVGIVKETNLVYLVEKQGASHEVPKSKMIRNTKSDSDHVYQVLNRTEITKGVEGQPLRKLQPEEQVKAVYIDEDYGIFKSEDGLKGYVSLNDLEKVVEDSITVGTSRVTKIIKNNGKTYGLSRGRNVDVKDYTDGHYIIVDKEGNEFRVAEKDIMLEGKLEQTSRGISINRSSDADRLVAAAHKELGKPYVSGDTGSRGYDCSGLTYSLYLNTLDIRLPRDSRGQATAGSHVSKSNLEPGDLVFFRTSGPSIGHVGLYIGNNNMIHASTSQRKMIVTDIDTSYFAQRYVTARRIVD